MRGLALGIAAFSALVGASGAAFAFNEASVNKADIARVGSEVAAIQDTTVRAEASGYLTEASGYVTDGEHQRAYLALKAAQALAQANQVAEAAK